MSLSIQGLLSDQLSLNNVIEMRGYTSDCIEMLLFLQHVQTALKV